MRRNNINDMTICEQLDVIADSICSFCCKYREQYNNQNIDKETLISFCKECPLTKI